MAYAFLPAHDELMDDARVLSPSRAMWSHSNIMGDPSLVQESLPLPARLQLLWSSRVRLR